MSGPAAPDVGYLVAAALVAGLVTFALRAVPFALLRPLRESALIARLGAWMPAGVMTALATVMLLQAASLGPGRPWDPGRTVCAVVAAAVTVAVHLLCGRRLLLSVAAGTLAYVLPVNLLL